MRRIRVGLSFTYFLLMAIVFATCSPVQLEIRKMTTGVRRRCIAETGVSLQVLDDSEIGVFPEDEKLKCYYKCTLEKFNMFTKKGDLNYSLMKKIVPEHFKEIGHDMIDSCMGITEPERCQLAFSFMKCLYVANPVAFFVP